MISVSRLSRAVLLAIPWGGPKSLNLKIVMAFVKSVPESEESVAAVLRRYPQQAVLVTETPSRMVQADVDAIFNAGCDEDCFHYTVMICGLFNLMNRMMDGYGVKNTAEGRLINGRKLVDTGYRVVTDARNPPA